MSGKVVVPSCEIKKIIFSKIGQPNGRTGIASLHVTNDWFFEIEILHKPSRKVWNSILITLLPKPCCSIPMIIAVGIDGSIGFQTCK